MLHRLLPLVHIAAARLCSLESFAYSILCLFLISVKDDNNSYLLLPETSTWWLHTFGHYYRRIMPDFSAWLY